MMLGIPGHWWNDIMNTWPFMKWCYQYLAIDGMMLSIPGHWWNDVIDTWPLLEWCYWYLAIVGMMLSIPGHCWNDVIDTWPLLEWCYRYLAIDGMMLSIPGHTDGRLQPVLPGDRGQLHGAHQVCRGLPQGTRPSQYRPLHNYTYKYTFPIQTTT